MNYRHVYHAGNFADVAKHVGLLYCLDALKRKDAAVFRARHPRRAAGSTTCRRAEARKSAEADRGVQRLIENGIGTAPLADYFAAVRRAPRQAPGALSGLPGPHCRRVAAAGSRAVLRASAGRGARRRTGGRIGGPHPL